MPPPVVNLTIVPGSMVKVDVREILPTTYTLPACHVVGVEIDDVTATMLANGVGIAAGIVVAGGVFTVPELLLPPQPPSSVKRENARTWMIHDARDESFMIVPL
jgi:hypothetical protein